MVHIYVYIYIYECVCVCVYFRYMGLRTIDNRTFSQIQRLYCVPTIDTFWNEINNDQLKQLVNKPVVIAGMSQAVTETYFKVFCQGTWLISGLARKFSIQSAEIVQTRSNMGSCSNFIIF